MCNTLPSYILGYHGCDRQIGEAILSGKQHIKLSKNRYDWLGKGAYFWEDNPGRALKFAKQAGNDPEITQGDINDPFVLGAIISTGNCLNLLETKSINLVKNAYADLKYLADISGGELPVNLDIGKKSIKGGGDFLLRFLDCAVINFLIGSREDEGSSSFDSVRGVFVEGNEIYRTSGFYENTHIQICVRNLECIKGFFRVRPFD